MGSPTGKGAGPTKKHRKYNRNRRYMDDSGRVFFIKDSTTYRQRHGIPSGPRAENHKTHACPVHNS